MKHKFFSTYFRRDRVLFGVCLYTACRIAEACSLMVKDIYTNAGTVRSTINFRKGNTKGKLQTRTIPVIEDLRALRNCYKPSIVSFVTSEPS
ncbi:MAG: tyrosine-type recombinase/integrase [Actinomycetota bacterium]